MHISMLRSLDGVLDCISWKAKTACRIVVHILANDSMKTALKLSKENIVVLAANTESKLMGGHETPRRGRQFVSA